MTKVIKKSTAIPKLVSAGIQVAIDRGLIDLIGSRLHKLPAGVVTILGTLLYAAVHGWSYFSNTSDAVQSWEPGTVEIIGAAVMVVTEIAARLASAEKTVDGQVVSASKAEKMKQINGQPSPLITPTISPDSATFPNNNGQTNVGTMTDISQK